MFPLVLFSLLASGSDDQHAIIWDPFKHKKLTTMHTGHAANIFSVKVRQKLMKRKASIDGKRPQNHRQGGKFVGSYHTIQIWQLHLPRPTRIVHRQGQNCLEIQAPGWGFCYSVLNALVPCSFFLTLATVSWWRVQQTPRSTCTTLRPRRPSTCSLITPTASSALPRHPCGPTPSGVLQKMASSGQGPIWPRSWWGGTVDCTVGQV